MTIERFFDLFLKELENAPNMHNYYKFLNNKTSFEFRKAYFMQRLHYVSSQIKNKEATIWDCGCGYGTSALFLAMNGIKVYGTTLEFYFDQIEKRKQYWNQYGNADLFEVDYADIFDNTIADNSFDYIILQDTLHHIEPLHEAMLIFHRILRPQGKLIVTEVNGNNLVENLIFFKQRGFKKIITIWDERLQKNILVGNENVRKWKTWVHELEQAGIMPDSTDPQYIRYYYPHAYKGHSAEEMIAREEQLSRKKILRKYFFFGINFSATVNK